MICSVRIAPSALGLSTSASSVMIASGATTVAADFVGERLRPRRVDVGDADPRAFLRRQPGEAGGDAARALDGEMQAGEAVLAERPLHRRLDAEIDAVAGVRPRIAADRALRDRQAGDIAASASRTATMSATLMPTSSAVT